MLDNIYEKGIFLEECKNRFLCKVLLRGTEELCYISSSSKLSHFITLAGREVLLKKNSSTKSRTSYTVQAVKAEQGYILLNLNFINKLLGEEFIKPDSLYAGAKTICCEKKLGNILKVDFLIEGDSTIIVEAKGIISEGYSVKFPAMVVERAMQQLQVFAKLMEEGFLVNYYIVLMNPAIEQVRLDKSIVVFSRLFKKCLKKGMEVYIYKVLWRDEQFSVVRDRIIETNFIESVYKRKKERA